MQREGCKEGSVSDVLYMGGITQQLVFKSICFIFLITEISFDQSVGTTDWLLLFYSKVWGATSFLKGTFLKACHERIPQHDIPKIQMFIEGAHIS